MKLEGRIATGLDEFMLRLGHLKVLLDLLATGSGNRQRLARRLAEELTQLVAVPPAQMQDVGRYLANKELSHVTSWEGTSKSPRPKARYKHLRVHLSVDGGIERIVDDRSSSPARIWFQDLAIADSRTRSKVGAVTTDREQITNKSGVSHLIDWAVILGVATKRLGLTTVGRTLKSLRDKVESDEAHGGTRNPYVIGAERVVFLWLLAQVDGDVLIRLLPVLAGSDEIVKSEAMEMMLSLAAAIQDDLNKNRNGMSNTGLRVLRSLKEDLGTLMPSRARRSKPSSTVWHRISSRLEALTDVGLLEKTDKQGVPHHFEYYYRPTAALRVACDSLRDAVSIQDWAANHIVDFTATSLGVELTNDGCEPELFDAALLTTGQTGIHIDSFAIAAGTLALARGKRLTIARARQALEDLATRHPEIARLSRGYVGSGAEFASVIVSKLEALGPAAFGSS